MRELVTIFCCLATASCSSNPVVSAPDQRRQSDQLIGDLTPIDQRARREARPADMARTDLPTTDTKRPIVDAKPPVADAPPPVADTKPGSLQVKVVSADVWANLMPIVAPDPTTVKLTLSFTNSGSADVTGLKLTDGQLQPVPSGTALSIELVAQAPFAGVVPAGQTVSVDFARVKKTTAVPLPTTCNGKLKVGFTVQHAGGSIGPLWSGDLTFVCAY